MSHESVMTFCENVSLIPTGHCASGLFNVPNTFCATTGHFPQVYCLVCNFWALLLCFVFSESKAAVAAVIWVENLDHLAS